MLTEGIIWKASSVQQREKTRLIHMTIINIQAGHPSNHGVHHSSCHYRASQGGNPGFTIPALMQDPCTTQDSPIRAMCSAFFTSCSARVLKRFEVYLYIL